MSHKFEKRCEARQSEIRVGSVLAHVTKRIAAITPPRALVVLRFLLNTTEETDCFWPNPTILCYLTNYICSAETGEMFGLGNYELWYLRTKDGEEVDFLVTRDGDPWFLVEAKLNEAVPSTALRKFQSQLHVPAVQLVRRSGIQRVLSNEPDRILVCDAASWLPGLG